MASVTAASLIRQALLKLGVLAGNEEPDASQGQDGLIALNNLVDGWAGERLMIPVTAPVTLSWTANQISRTIGPSGNFAQAKPIEVEGASYVIPGSSPAQEVSLAVLNVDQYFLQPVKTLTSTLPTELYYDRDSINSENGTLFLWPVPTQTLSIVILIPSSLTAFADLDTTYQMPTTYPRALVYNLATEIAPDYGVSPLPAVERTAMGSKRLVKSLNTLPAVLSVDEALAPRGGSYDVYSDQGS
jgi:hypothetical protein